MDLRLATNQFQYKKKCSQNHNPIWPSYQHNPKGKGLKAVVVAAVLPIGLVKASAGMLISMDIWPNPTAWSGVFRAHCQTVVQVLLAYNNLHYSQICMSIEYLYSPWLVVNACHAQHILKEFPQYGHFLWHLVVQEGDDGRKPGHMDKSCSIMDFICSNS
ncbi:hypothetical protein ARMGADRAFT_1039633 [Armillaria gallica]|uniref:Uncharacterized protein n=1 Tax=Armillaria gallica TaxID=47427 RepID=A0A2H3D0K1_ARMGA|nr:hypothetical protein ARMGADRAFT_1039633 [Armillaria gallica]